MFHPLNVHFRKNLSLSFGKLTFFINQMNSRKLFIVGLDTYTTSKNIANQNLKVADIEKVDTEFKRIHQATPRNDFDCFTWDESNDLPYDTSSHYSHTHNHIGLNNLILICHKYTDSNQAGASIANNLLQDYEIITTHLVIDGKKLR